VSVRCLSVSGDNYRAGICRFHYRRHNFHVFPGDAVDRNTVKPLTPEQAKERLRSVASNMGPAAFIRKNPRETVGMAFVAGMLAGKSSRADEALANTLISLLLNTTR
jgi:hypothetical protein